ncbi:tail assembly protein [Burkholderia sp. 22PA0099]|uniref:tail assembly protein n=1 Tax=Burkholderia sp. 22PA0099 TaxID=3237372 RepID=UPI0039C10363
MNESLRTIRLYGVLGNRFGRVHRLAVRSTAEAIRALSVVVPGFKGFLVGARERGLTFAVFVGKRNVSQDELAYPTSGNDIRIAPVLVGSKKAGLLQTIIGAVLIVVGAITYAYGGAAVTNYGISMIAMGASMSLGGVIQMLSPQAGGLGSTVDNGTSYYFNGPVNSSAQGEPAPIVYGRMTVGSKRVSSGIFAQDQK